MDQVRRGIQINSINEVNETEEPPREYENITAEETVELDVETKELKYEILRKILQIKFTDIEDRERLSKIRTNKKGEKLIERAKIDVTEILIGFEEALATTKEIIYIVAYTITEKLNGEPKSCIGKRMHKQSRCKTKFKQEINALKGEESIIEEILRSMKIKSRKLSRMKKYSMKKTGELPSLKETLKQKIQLKEQRIRRNEKTN